MSSKRPEGGRAIAAAWEREGAREWAVGVVGEEEGKEGAPALANPPAGEETDETVPVNVAKLYLPRFLPLP